jgi:hypothetical protein
VSYEQGLAYDRKDLSQLLKAFKAMDAEATKVQLKLVTSCLNLLLAKLKAQALPAHLTTKAARRIVDEYQSRAPQRLVSYPTAFARQRFFGRRLDQKSMGRL